MGTFNLYHQSRMKVHLFGEASLPGCANYGLKHVAAQGPGRFNKAPIRFVERNFYVDDGLTSVSTEDKAIQLVSEARQRWQATNPQVHFEPPRGTCINS